MGKTNGKAIKRLDQNTMWDLTAVFTLAFIVSVVPLMLRLHKIELSETLKKYWTGNTTVIDIFSHIKMQLLVGCLVILGLYWFTKVFLKMQVPIPKMLIAFGVHVIFVILSTLFAEHIGVAFTGFTERYEGLIVLLTYFMILFTAYALIRDEQRVNYVLFALMISSSVMGFIGISQFFGFDLLQTGLARWLMTPAQYKEIADTLVFNFAGQKVMYTTVYNPNYLGSYSVLILPISIALYFYYVDKSKKNAIISLVAAFFGFALWLGGMSRAGLVGGIALLIFLIFFLRKVILKKWKATVALLLGFVIIYAGMDIYSGGLVTNEFISTNPLSASSGIFPQGSTDGTVTSASNRVKSAKLKDDVFTFETPTELFIMKLEGDILGFYTKDDKALSIAHSGSKIVFTDAGFEKYSVEIEEGTAYLYYDEVVIPFLFTEKGMLYAPSRFLHVSEVGEIESFGFENNFGFGNGRGYLWSRSIPLLKDTILLGHGPDTYPMYFPQEDIAGKINGLGQAILVVDKPHNWYLQVGINTGVISLIALLVFLAWFVIKSFMQWLKAQDTYDYYVGISILCAVIGYCIAALFNDSNVAVAPIFWILLGIGVAYLYKDDVEKKHFITKR